MVRGVPDIAFFLFFVIALDQALEWIRHKVNAPTGPSRSARAAISWSAPAAKLPLGNSPQWMHETYNFSLAVFTFAIVFGAFAANVLYGAMRAVPRPQTGNRRSLWHVAGARRSGASWCRRCGSMPCPACRTSG